MELNKDHISDVPNASVINHVIVLPEQVSGIFQEATGLSSAITPVKKMQICSY